MLIMLAVFGDDFSPAAWAATVNVAVTGVLMTTIVHAIMSRQQERFRRLYEVKTKL